MQPTLKKRAMSTQKILLGNYDYDELSLQRLANYNALQPYLETQRAGVNPRKEKGVLKPIQQIGTTKKKRVRKNEVEEKISAWDTGNDHDN